MLLNYFTSVQIVDWRKDKGKVKDHKTFIDVTALKACISICIYKFRNYFVQFQIYFLTENFVIFRSYGWI